MQERSHQTRIVYVPKEMKDTHHLLLSHAILFLPTRQRQLPPPLVLFVHIIHTDIAHSCRKKVVTILSSSSPTSSVPDVSSPSHHPFGRCLQSINGRSHVKIEDRLASGFQLGRVVVYHITDFSYSAVRGLALDVPVVAVKRGVVAASLPSLAGCSKSKGEGGTKEIVIGWGWIRTYANLGG